ncbi:hypothetical protein [Actinokineospora sp. NBRC 105648]|uniref:hypothetical protein n=1 Tax=Actinokineospora sp. NBRC 105648 TaxID=3032206 RepID=UPI0024A53A80|nr:hypothetical protein [Actinokineospora sp. NBRC 105648]GLZ37623.1 hypothetical protein Acsp05_12480 [Actinokineospora sp. NBRC 105648]
MYLRQIYIKNIGPISEFEYDVPVDPETEVPFPVIFVGANGSGKTHLLSIVGDAFYECASIFYHDVSRTTTAGRAYFRVISSQVRKYGQDASLAFLNFTHNGASYEYQEVTGNVTQDFVDGVPERCSGIPLGQVDQKTFSMPSETVEKVLNESSVLYIPASRFELPNWMNSDSIPPVRHNITQRFKNQLRKPIYVQQALDEFVPWLLSVALDARVDFAPARIGDDYYDVAIGNIPSARMSQLTFTQLNAMMKIIMNDETARFAYLSRHNSPNLAYALNDVILPLNSLSTGQASLLSIFGTLMRYGDMTTNGSHSTSIRSICVIDEVDSHLHTDLQYRALPQLLAMFPKVQFLASAHSPMFVLGIGRAYQENVSLIELPSGNPIQAEAFSEFEKAFDVMRETSAFNAAVLDRTNSASKRVLVLCEGETDPQYLTCAARKLGRSELLEKMEFQWVGSKGETGQASNTGKEALNKATTLLKGNPYLKSRTVVLLFDNDTNKQDEDLGSELYVRAMPTNADNKIIQAGVENLLPERLITEDMWTLREIRKPNGDFHTFQSLDKTKLCNYVCENGISEDFARFAAVLNKLEALTTSNSVT